MNTGLLEAIAIVSAEPDVHWEHGDDLCNCTFQRIGTWANPYIGKTLKVRMCCIWESIYAQFPEFVQRIDGAWDDNTRMYNPEPQDWDSTDWDMPLHIWHRHLAAKTGKTLDEIRVEYADQTPPKRLEA